MRKEDYGKDEILVPGKIRGYRTWKLRPHGDLQSMGNHGFVWETSELTARCLSYDRLYYSIKKQAQEMHDENVDETPSKDCTCGIYAYHDPSEFVSGSGYVISDSCILGVIEAEGKVIAGKLGFRAQKAKIVALSLNPFGSIGTAEDHFALNSVDGMYNVVIGDKSSAVVSISRVFNGMAVFTHKVRVPIYLQGSPFVTSNINPYFGVSVGNIRDAIIEARWAEARGYGHFRADAFKYEIPWSVVPDRCESPYPKATNLYPSEVIRDLKKRYEVPVFSDYRQMYAEFPMIPMPVYSKKESQR